MHRWKMKSASEMFFEKLRGDGDQIPLRHHPDELAILSPGDQDIVALDVPVQNIPLVCELHAVAQVQRKLMAFVRPDSRILVI